MNLLTALGGLDSYHSPQKINDGNNLSDAISGRVSKARGCSLTPEMISKLLLFSRASCRLVFLIGFFTVTDDLRFVSHTCKVKQKTIFKP